MISGQRPREAGSDIGGFQDHAFAIGQSRPPNFSKLRGRVGMFPRGYHSPNPAILENCVGRRDPRAISYDRSSALLLACRSAMPLVPIWRQGIPWAALIGKELSCPLVLTDLARAVSRPVMPQRHCPGLGGHVYYLAIAPPCSARQAVQKTCVPTPKSPGAPGKGIEEERIRKRVA